MLTAQTPCIDIDIGAEEAAEEIEALAKNMLGENAVRIGRPPKRCLLFRADTPFRKLSATFVERAGVTHKIEILGDGQQVVVNGIHPETKRPYRWHGGEPGPKLPRKDLPLLTAETAAAFLAAASDLLTQSRMENGRGQKAKRRRTPIPDVPKPHQPASVPMRSRARRLSPRSWPHRGR